MCTSKRVIFSCSVSVSYSRERKAKRYKTETPPRHSLWGTHCEYRFIQSRVCVYVASLTYEHESINNMRAFRIDMGPHHMQTFVVDSRVYRALQNFITIRTRGMEARCCAPIAGTLARSRLRRAFLTLCFLFCVCDCVSSFCCSSLYTICTGTQAEILVEKWDKYFDFARSALDSATATIKCAIQRSEQRRPRPWLLRHTLTHSIGVVDSTKATGAPAFATWLAWLGTGAERLSRAALLVRCSHIEGARTMRARAFARVAHVHGQRRQYTLDVIYYFYK